MTRTALALLSVLLLAGCQSAYYNTMERFGIEKRDILVDRVRDARDSQVEGQEEFKDALEQFRSVVNFDGGDLEDVYDDLNSEYEDSKDAAAAIQDRVNAVERVAEDLFQEWDEELNAYSNYRLRRDSERKLRQTRLRYAELITAMRDAESRLDPVLEAMQDQVLYLKHNLNARAIQGMRGELNEINRDVDELIVAMEQAIREADAFIQEMQTQT